MMVERQRNDPFGKAVFLYYCITGILEGLYAEYLLLHVPPDPKNAWLFGYSANRILMACALLAAALPFFLGLWKSLRDQTWLDKVLSRLNFAISGIFLFLFFAAASFVVVLIVPHLYFEYRQNTVLVERVYPFLFFAASRLLQTLLACAALYIRQLTRERQPISIGPAQAGVILGTIVFWLASANVSSNILRDNPWDLRIRYFFITFNMDQEYNVPAIFAALDLLLASIILLVIALQKIRAKGQYQLSWGLLSLIFLILSIDEAFLLHEKMSRPMDEFFHGTGVMGFFPWLYAGIPAVLLFAIAYLKFFMHLPRRTQVWFFLAGFLYISGAILMEMAGGWYTILFGVNKNMRFVIYTIEETLELSGVVVFIVGLLDYRRIPQLVEERKLSLRSVSS
jgi:hypothetical protein